MSSLNSKDRVSLCLFTFEDGRRCRTPRIGGHPHFCFYHAQKEARTRTVAYLLQTLLQSIDISQDEYINAFSTDGWRKTVRHSVTANHTYLHPPKPATTAPPAPPPT
jgi:hypothetical protein